MEVTRARVAGTAAMALIAAVAAGSGRIRGRASVSSLEDRVLRACSRDVHSVGFCPPVQVVARLCIAGDDTACRGEFEVLARDGEWTTAPVELACLRGDARSCAYPVALQQRYSVDALLAELEARCREGDAFACSSEGWQASDFSAKRRAFAAACRRGSNVACTWAITFADGYDPVTGEMYACDSLRNAAACGWASYLLRRCEWLRAHGDEKLPPSRGMPTWQAMTCRPPDPERAAVYDARRRKLEHINLDLYAFE